ncbi:MAG: hypothetical protein IJD22_03430 [Clostridia bacterium]|nr:hypothetical protein [Clostridia bacterium]
MKRITALILAALLAASALSACKNSKEPADETAPGAETTVQNEETTAPEEEEAKFAEVLSAERIGEMENVPRIAKGGIYYKGAEGKYGIMTFDGECDTGAVYDNVSACGNFFSVREKALEESLEPDALNITGLADAWGNLLLPCEYFMIEALNDRFVKAYKAIELTENRDEAMLYVSTSGWHTLSPGEEDPMFKGEWVVFDTVDGALVEGAAGNKREYTGKTVTASGNYVTYYDSNYRAVTVDAKGNAIGEEYKLLRDGTLLQTVDGKGIVFSPEGEKLFTYELSGYVPYEPCGDYYVCRKIEDGDADYVLVDRSGEMVLDLVDGYGTFPEGFGSVILWERTVYDLEGNVLLENCHDLECSNGSRSAALLESEGRIVMVDAEGNELFSTDLTDDMYYEGFTVCKESDGTAYFYSHADGDYTIEAYKYASIGAGLIEKELSNGVYALLDTFSGEAVLENHKDYIFAESTEGKYYVYALNTSANYEIYEIK